MVEFCVGVEDHEFAAENVDAVSGRGNAGEGAGLGPLEVVEYGLGEGVSLLGNGRVGYWVF